MKKVFLIALVLTVALFSLVSGCASRQAADESGKADSAALGYGYTRDAGSPMEDGELAYEEYGEDGYGNHGQRYAVKTGEIAVNVEDIRESERKIRQFVEEKRGFIASSNFYTDSRGDYQNSYLTVRVPQEHFDVTMLFLEEDLGRLTSSHSQDTDVTLQYVDMEARINNLARQEERYAEILQKADTVEEILQIERELVRIRGDIESLTAQFTHLKDRVSYSTIHISIRQTVTATPGVTAVGFEGAWERAVTALTESLNTLINGAANFFVFSFRAMPYAALVLIGLFGLYKVLKKFDRRSSQKTQ